MDTSIDIWRMLAGVAIFILGMSFMEESLKSLAGRKFKLFLKKQTENKVKAIGSGTLVTGLLQSSSIVNMLVLSLVGAGVLTMYNALSVMIGANLGSTVNSWLIATVGFKFNIENYALALAGITGVGMAFFNPEKKTYRWLRFLFGFSFLFVGLGFIKEGMEDFMRDADLSRFEGYPLIAFLLIGIVLTTIVQSSSATMALALSALFSNAITLTMAMGIVLGAEIGTTIKLFYASIRGTVEKKRVALGNFLFNVIVVIIIFALLLPVHHLITEIIGIKDNLIALVFFQSFTNVVGIVLFYPFLNLLGRFLEQRFKDSEFESRYISKVHASDTDLALDALEKETYYFICHVLALSTSAFESGTTVKREILHKEFLKKPVMDQYEFVKRLHGEIHQFYIQLLNSNKSEPETARLEQLISCVRNTMYAAKNIKDALQDIHQARNSSNDIKYQFFLKRKEDLEKFTALVFDMVKRKGNVTLEEVSGFYRETQENYSKSLSDLYKEGMDKHLDEVEISMLLNFNREMSTAYKSLLFALKDYLLSPEDADKFDNVPGFIR